MGVVCSVHESRDCGKHAGSLVLAHGMETCDQSDCGVSTLRVWVPRTGDGRIERERAALRELVV